MQLGSSLKIISRSSKYMSIVLGFQFVQNVEEVCIIQDWPQHYKTFAITKFSSHWLQLARKSSGQATPYINFCKIFQRAVLLPLKTTGLGVWMHLLWVNSFFRVIITIWIKNILLVLKTSIQRLISYLQKWLSILTARWYYAYDVYNMKSIKKNETQDVWVFVTWETYITGIISSWTFLCHSIVV